LSEGKGERPSRTAIDYIVYIVKGKGAENPGGQLKYERRRGLSFLKKRSGRLFPPKGRKGMVGKRKKKEEKKKRHHLQQGKSCHALSRGNIQKRGKKRKMQ